MNAIRIHFIIFVCIFGAVLFGMFLRAILPEQHLSGDSKDTIRLGIGVIDTMSALVLGLLVSSAKNLFDAQSGEITQMSAEVILLDHALAQYGPEAKEIRDLLRGTVARTLDLVWHQAHQQNSEMQPTLVGNAISMLKFGRCPQRTIFNTQPRSRRRALLWISENSAGSCSNRDATPSLCHCW